MRVLSTAAVTLGFSVPGSSRNFKLRMEGHSRRGPLVALAQVFEMCPGLYMCEVRKVRGDTLEFNEFYRQFEAQCAPIVLAAGGGAPVAPTTEALAAGGAAMETKPLLSSSI
jgi:hypothetical protein